MRSTVIKSRLLLAATGLACAMVVSCSSNAQKDSPSPEKKDETVAEDAQKLETEFQGIPKAAIVRVPVDADGNATGEPEMRIYNGAADIESEDAIETAFAEGAAPEAMVGGENELDGDSSTQSWQSYRYCRGYSYGQCGYRSYTHSYWHQSYRPKLYWRGYRWSYGWGRPYYKKRRGYRYYCYNRHRYW